MSINIREARPDDCEHILDLIKDLTVESGKTAERVTIDAEDIRENGFGDEKFIHCLVAESTDEPKPIGYSLYFFNFSTWDGRSLYMEDLYVTPKWRSKGLGTKIWKTVAKIALEKKCNRMQWAVLGWNSRAINFYKKMGSIDLTTEEDWHLYKMNLSELQKFVNS